MLRWRSVAIATTPGTRGSDVTRRFRAASTVGLKFSILLPPCLLLRLAVEREPAAGRETASLLTAYSLFMSTSRSAHRETFVAAGGDRVAFLPVGADATDIRQQPPGLTLNVGPHVPGVCLDHESRGGSLLVVLDPAVLGLFRRLANLEIVLAHVVDAGGHVAERCRRRERSCGREQVGIAVHLQPHGGADVAGPIFLERPSVASANVDAGQRARSCVESGGEDQDVERVLRAVFQFEPI